MNYEIARRFASEPAIEFMLKTYSKEFSDNNTRQISPTKIFEAFKSSSSVEDFLQKAEFHEKFRKRMLALHSDDLKKEYQDLWYRYMIKQGILSVLSEAK